MDGKSGQIQTETDMIQSDSQGVLGSGTFQLGDGDTHPGKYNMALVRRAIKNGWPISPEIRKLVVDQMAAVVSASEEDRNRIAAAKVLVAADGVNAKRESAETPQLHLHAQLQVIEEIVDAPRPALGDSETDPAAQAAG